MGKYYLLLILLVAACCKDYDSKISERDCKDVIIVYYSGDEEEATVCVSKQMRLINGYMMDGYPGMIIRSGVKKVIVGENEIEPEFTWKEKIEPYGYK